MALDITTADILSGTRTFGDIHPNTCENVDLRNLKANALCARMEFNIREDAGSKGPQTRREADATRAMALLSIDLTDGYEDAMKLIHLAIDFAEKECA